MFEIFKRRDARVEFTYAYLQVIDASERHRSPPIGMQQIYVYYLYTQAMRWKIGRSVVKLEQAENEAYDCEARI